MKLKTLLSTAAVALISLTQSSFAAGELNIFTWGNILSPDLIKRFEQQYDVKVTLTDYESSDEALVKIRRGGHGFDGAVIISSYVPIWVEEGLLAKTNPAAMENFPNVKDEWKDPPYDPGMEYTVPYEIGITGIAVNTSIYKGDINTSAIVLDPPPELAGKINVVPGMDEIMYLATRYVGGEACSTNVEVMRKVRDLTVAARAKWASIDYGSIDNYAKGDVYAGVNWYAETSRAKDVNPDIEFGFPREGFPAWVDVFAVLEGGKNSENAKLFQNFLMTPQSGADMTIFTHGINAIKGSEVLIPEELRERSQLNLPSEVRANMDFLRACPPDALAFQNAIWTAIHK